jgi:hypothetical protein
MRTSRNRLITSVAVMSLALVIGFVMNHSVAAQSGGPRVTIDGPLPLPVDASSQTVLVLNETREVSPGGPLGLHLGPIDVSGFKQIRVASRLVSGGSANVTVTPLLEMTPGIVEGLIPLAPSSNLGGTVVVDVPGTTVFLRIMASETTTGQYQVYGRK